MYNYNSAAPFVRGTDCSNCY